MNLKLFGQTQLLYYIIWKPKILGYTKFFWGQSDCQNSFIEHSLKIATRGFHTTGDKP